MFSIRVYKPYENEKLMALKECKSYVKKKSIFVILKNQISCGKIISRIK